MGAAAKTDGSRYAGVRDPGHSSGARAAFRNNPKLQETLFAGYTKANHSYLMRNPKYRNANQQRRLQILGYAHNQGMGGANNWLNTGRVGVDGFGTKGTKYTDAIAAEFRKRGGGKKQAPAPPPAKTAPSPPPEAPNPALAPKPTVSSLPSPSSPKITASSSQDDVKISPASPTSPPSSLSGERRGQQIAILEEESQPMMAGGGSGTAQIILSGDSLNSIIKKKFLLDLAYT